MESPGRWSSRPVRDVLFYLLIICWTVKLSLHFVDLTSHAAVSAHARVLCGPLVSFLWSVYLGAASMVFQSGGTI